jgi:DNA-binding NtrC family response regulator
VSPDGVNRSTVVCVDEDEMILDLLVAALPRTGPFEVEGFTDVGAALSRIRGGGVDCVVSDYEMPEFDGFALLERVRSPDPDVPFILYTGRGSEEIASDALSRGVTDYLRKESGTAQFALLGWRIEEAIAKYVAERETDRRLRAMETVRKGICIVREDGTFEYANGASLDLYGYREDDLLDAEWRLLHPASVVERTPSEVLPVAREEGSGPERASGGARTGRRSARGSR